MSELLAESVEDACRRVLDRWRDSGLLAVYLYGSVLTGRHRPDSDIDVAALDREDQRLDWSEQARLMDELERAVGRPIDLRMLRECTLSHQSHVFVQGRLGWTADRHQAKEYARETQRRQRAQLEDAQKRWSTALRELASRLTDRDESRVAR